MQQCFRTSEREPHTYSLDAVVAETNILKKNKVTFSSILIFLLCFWGLVAPSWKFSGIALFWSIVLLNFQYKTTTHKGRNTNEKQRQQNMGKQMKAKQTQERSCQDYQFCSESFMKRSQKETWMQTMTASVGHSALTHLDHFEYFGWSVAALKSHRYKSSTFVKGLTCSMSI